MTLKLCGLSARTWLSACLQACADNGNQAPPHIDAFLTWAMEAARLVAMRACLTGDGLVVEGIDTS